MKIIEHDLPRHLELEIYPLADVHIGDPLQDKKQVEKFIVEVMAEKNRYVIVNGDMLNWASKTSVSDVYGEELTPNQQIDCAVELLEPIKDRVLLIIDGNHEKRAWKSEGISPMYQVAKRLGIFNTYSEGAYILFISFGKSMGRSNRKMIYSLYGKHGSGGGRTPGAKINRLVQMGQTIDADIYLHSHTHLPIITKIPFYRCDYRNRKITRVDKLYVNSNAFLGFGGYGEELGMPPATVQYPKIVLDGRERIMKGIL